LAEILLALSPDVSSPYTDAMLLSQPKLTRRVVSQQIVQFVHEEEYAPYNVTEFFNDDVLDKWNKLMPRMNNPLFPSTLNKPS
jgi:hypothetical protein